MAKYKYYSYEQSLLLAVNFSKQILTGTLEYTINWLVENKIKTNIFKYKYHNDKTGAPAYSPKILLMVTSKN